MDSHSTYTKAPITKQSSESGSAHLTYELNGGAAVLVKLIGKHIKKNGQTKKSFGEATGIRKAIVYNYSMAKHTGITMGTLRRFAKAFGLSTFALSKKLKLSTSGKKQQAKPEMPKLGELMEALGVNKAEAACSLTVGNERVTVERMPGQDRSQPIVVEHSGHRLTVEKV